MKMMENTCDFEGVPEDYRRSSASTDLTEELATRLMFSVHQVDHFTQMQEKDSDSKNKFLFVFFGGALGAACGGVTGGVGGALWAASAATYSVFCGDFTAVGAAVSFVGSMVGGAVGGAFWGSFGGAVGAAAAKETFNPGFIRLLSDISLVTLGCATGGAIGCSFHKTVGTIGGAAGAAFGALVARDLAAGLAGILSDHLSRNRDSVEPIQKLFLILLKQQQDKRKQIAEEVKKMTSTGVEKLLVGAG